MSGYAKAPSVGSNLGAANGSASSRCKRLALLTLAFALIAVLTASPASAGKTHLNTDSFGPDGTEATSFANLQGLAVDQGTGEVFAFDAGAGKIYKFDSAGNPVDFSALGANAIEGVAGAGGGENQIAVAPAGAAGGTAGDVYLAAYGHGVSVYGPDGTKRGEFGEVTSCGLATDAAGHLFVGVYPETVNEYLPTANAPYSAELKASSTGKVSEVCNVTVDGDANIYAASYSGAMITKLAGIAAAAGTKIEPGAPTLAIDPSNEDLYADRANEVAQYDSAGALLLSFGSGQLANSYGVAINGAGEKIYVANTGKIEVFDSAIVTLPDVTTEAPSALKRTTATLNGTISAAEGPQASCEFQYTSEAKFQSEGFKGAASAPCDPAGPFTGASTTAVKAELSALSAQTKYRFRLVGSNESGANPANVLSFETAVAVNLQTGQATNIAKDAATLNGAINPEGVELEECFFEYVDQEEFEASEFSAAQKQSCTQTPAQIGSGEAPVSVHTDLSGLTANTEYRFRLAAKSSLGEVKGAAQSFETLGPPEIVGQSVGEITTTSATVSALIDPNGEATTFQVEYVSEADFLASGYAKAIKLPVPAKAIGQSTSAVEASQQLGDLAPETAYHFRLVATNAAGPPVVGPDQSFVTFAPDVGLPDSRAYEMVSPPHKLGEVFPPEVAQQLGSSCSFECLPGGNGQLMPMQSDPGGNAVVYTGDPFAFGLAAGHNEYLSERSEAGWATRSISPLLSLGGEIEGYKAFSADLSRAVIYQSSPALSLAAPSFEGHSFANLYLRTADGSLQPLVTAPPPNRDPVEISNRFNVVFAGANAGTGSTTPLSHLIFAADDALTGAVPGSAPAAPEVGASRCAELGEGCNLYEWVGGQLRLINVAPGNGAAMAGATIGSGKLLARFPGAEGPAVDQAISADGSRIFWTDEASGKLYVREDGARTLEVPGPGSCTTALELSERACFLSASVDGSRVLLSNGRLYDVEALSAPPADLTDGQGGFQGILGASEDLSRIYFVDTAVLTGAEANPYGDRAQAGEFNLYIWEGGERSFIGILMDNVAAGDNLIGSLAGRGDWRAPRGARTAQASSDGRHLAFMSQAPLTGYDSRRRGDKNCSGLSTILVCFEVFEYDALTGKLTCASCNPSGQRPLGGANLTLINGSSSGFPPFPQPGNLATEGQGRLFFESQDVLSPRDVNGHIQDVYEWEPNGVGGCTRVAGCISLISSGRSANDSHFLNSTPSGDDAFFVTREQLLPQDKDQRLDLYDARVGGGIAEEAVSPCLSGQACRNAGSPAPAAQSFGSSSFSGPGNRKPACRKHKKCHKQGKHRKHKKKQQRRAAKPHRGGSK